MVCYRLAHIRTMKFGKSEKQPSNTNLLIATIAAVLLYVAASWWAGSGESQQSAPLPESKPAKPVAEAAQPEPPTTKVLDIPLWEAAMRGNIEAVKQHLDAGADVNVKDDNWGATPLHFAARNGHKDVAELLVVKGAAMNAKDDDGRTPLHMVADIGHNGIAELLIAKGADVNAKDKKDFTPLDGAKNKPETADLLRKHGGKTGEELKAAGN